ncbi:MAG: hypothetical protein COA33_002715 [Fluviicola sp.]|nr:hypothetical protein [Fluviicola sp.]
MGELEKKKNTKDIILYTAEEFRKLALSFIPAGAAVNSFLDYQAGLKQKRIIDFSEKFKDVLELILGRKLHADDFTNEDFVDIMESVMGKVQSTKSILKLELFKNILLKKVVTPSLERDTLIQAVKQVDELNESQIIILGAFMNRKLTIGKISFSSIISHLNRVGLKVISTNSYGQEIEYKGEEPFISKKLVIYYFNDLINRGLVDEYEGHPSPEGLDIEPSATERWNKSVSYLKHNKMTGGSEYDLSVVGLTLVRLAINEG